MTIMLSFRIQKLLQFWYFKKMRFFNINKSQYKVLHLLENKT